MTDNLPKRRRGFRFSLRTMLMLITAFGSVLGWLGWNWRIVQERNNTLGIINKSMRTVVATRRLDPSPMPFPRNLMGDWRLKCVFVRRDLADSEVTRLRNTFPEAELRLVDNPVVDAQMLE